ncbi:MAG: hypothetical protein ACRDY7_14180 [Acidimicrobiia bacterium]
MLLVGFWTDVPDATVLLALGSVVFIAIFAFILGPRGRPVPPQRRSGGLSRALAGRADREGAH